MANIHTHHSRIIQWNLSALIDSLPEADNITFGVFEIGCIAHTRYLHFTSYCFTAHFLDVFQGDLYILDIDGNEEK